MLDIYTIKKITKTFYICFDSLDIMAVGYVLVYSNKGIRNENRL